MSHDGKPGEEKLELRHEEVPGYRPVFYVVFVAGLLYLAAVFYFYSAGGH